MARLKLSSVFRHFQPTNHVPSELAPKWPVHAATYDSYTEVTPHGYSYCTVATMYLQLLSLAVIKRLALLIATRSASSVLVSVHPLPTPITIYPPLAINTLEASIEYATPSKPVTP